MKLVLLNTTDGGSGGAEMAYRLHRSLRAADVDSTLIVRRATRPDETIVSAWAASESVDRLRLGLSGRLDRLPLRFEARQPSRWSVGWLGNGVGRLVDRFQPDLIHLHWVGVGLVPVAALRRFGRPILWTLHDSWPLTGGCHLPGDCDHYQTACGRCPLLGSRREQDMSRWLWRRKWKQWRDLPITLIAPSRWMADRARSSSLFRAAPVETIPNGVDLTRFRPRDRQAVRTRLGLPPDKKVILFGAHHALTDPNKGWPLLRAALEQLADDDRLQLVIFGADTAPDFPAVHFGAIDDADELAALYAAADVFVLPSWQENLPNTIIEALACGTPAVGFEVGGVGELIEHQGCGALARPHDPSDLARQIAWVLADDERRQRLADRARRRAEAEFDLKLMTQRHLDLYHRLLDSESVL